MSDLKSKLPDLKEFSSMATKLLNAVKTSMCEIFADYKQKREGKEATETHEEEVIVATKTKDTKETPNASPSETIKKESSAKKAD